MSKPYDSVVKDPSRPLSRPFGPHLVGDLFGVDKGFVSSAPEITKFAEDLCVIIGLKPMGEAHADLYSGPIRAWDGWSVTQHIETSHISIHTFEFGYVFLDIFSCRQFNSDEVQRYIEHRLVPTARKWQTIERGFMFPPELMEAE